MYRSLNKAPSGSPKIWEIDNPAVATPIAFTICFFSIRIGMDAHTCGDTKAALTPAKNLNVSIHKNSVQFHTKRTYCKKLIPSTITFSV